MTQNVGSLDRLIRMIVGVVLIAAPFVSGWSVLNGFWPSTIAIIAGLVMLGTATLRFCPLYTIFGIRTCKV